MLVFLDSHCECIQAWLESLLAPIVETSRTTVTIPIIDVIDYNTMALHSADLNVQGTFDMQMMFTWDPYNSSTLDFMKKNPAEPVPNIGIFNCQMYSVKKKYVIT